MSVTTETLQGYFEQYGWSFDQVEEDRFVTGFASDVVESFSILVTLATHWVYFAIAPFVKAPSDPACERKLYKHLLRSSQEINLAKFSVDSDGDIVLAVELPRENLNYAEFSDALDALSYYADEAYRDVYALATDPAAVSSFEEEEDLNWGEE
ncbi:MAG: YbjN domain-containing protein [Anaerolineae bacterium]|nr:YbjN domain-containing protein [Anaerolineae bacterium]